MGFLKMLMNLQVGNKTKNIKHLNKNVLLVKL